MPIINQIRECIFPGFSMLSQERQKVFNESPEGLELSRQVTQGEFTTPIHGFGMMGAVSLNKSVAQSAIKRFQARIQNTESVRNVQRDITNELLKECFLNYVFLEEDVQHIVAEREYSVALYSYFKRHKTLSQEVMDNWRTNFRSDTELGNNQLQMDEKLNTYLSHANALVTFLFKQSLSKKEQFYLAQHIYGYDSVQNKKESLISNLQRCDETLPVWMRYHDSHEVLSLGNALSWLANNMLSKPEKEYLDRIADAHTFYQFLGLSTENGGWELDYLDLYNYARNQETIAEFKTIMSVLMKPLQPFFHEYTQIAKYENNSAQMIIRALAPLLVMGIFIVFAFSLVAPFAIHAILEIFMLIPVLYLGLAAASVYITCKNQAYNSIYAYCWGGIYNTPAFQVSERMLSSFGEEPSSHPLCDQITTFYTDSLKQCDEVERLFASKGAGTLTTLEWEARKANINQKSTLLLEWYDIQAHPTLGSEVSKQIVSNRLRKEGHAEYVTLERDRDSYLDGVLSELDATPLSSQERVYFNRSLSFFPSERVQTLGAECVRHQERMEQMTLIYTQMDSHPTLNRV